MRPARRLCRRLLFDPVGRFGAQSPQDEERLVSLGAAPERVALTGNLKFDTPEPTPVERLETALRGMAGGRPILVAGSTMAGEEAIVLDAFERLERDAMLVLAARHPQRFDEAWREVEERSLPAMRRSRMENLRLPDSAGDRLAERPFAGRQHTDLGSESTEQSGGGQQPAAPGPGRVAGLPGRTRVHLPVGGGGLHRRFVGADRRPQPHRGGALRGTGGRRPVDGELPARRPRLRGRRRPDRGP